MSDPRNNHSSIGGGQTTEDKHVASYKPIPEKDTGEEVEYLDTEVYTQLKENELMETDGGDDLEDHWEHNGIKLMLNLYLQNIDKFRNPKIKKKSVWTDIGNAVGKGPNCCDKKFRNLKQTYIRLLKKRNRNEIGVIKWPYFKIFEQIYNENEFRASKNSLAKSKEKISPDGAEEKLLPKEQEVKIVTRVDMADAKYVVEDHRNGDAKIELDANKRQFTGLSKEELMKYAEDPFWVNVRWFMFVLFWALWLCMLAGAITIIIKAPKCAAPTPRTWFEEGPLVEVYEATYDEMLPKLPNLQSSKVKGMFVDVPTYQYGEPSVIDNFKSFVEKAKEVGVKVIVDLIPNYVSIDHEWFLKSVKKEAPYSDYFIWAAGTDYVNNTQNPPNNWISTENIPAWTKNEVRSEFYLHQYGVNQPDLNFRNEAVVKEFENALRAWMKAGAAGVRLNKARHLLVNMSFPAEPPATGRGSSVGSDHTQYPYYRHIHTTDQPYLDVLLAQWSDVVASTSDTPGDTVFTMAEEGGSTETEYFLSRNVTSLRPPMTSPITVTDNAQLIAKTIDRKLGKWPAMQLKSTPEVEAEVATFAILLPATPVFDLHQIEPMNNETTAIESLSHLVSLRSDASLEHGRSIITSVSAINTTQETLLACARWKTGHTGYLAVFNPLEEEQRANLTSLASVPTTLTVHHMSHAVKIYTNYTTNINVNVDNVLVPPKATIVLSYVPHSAVEN